ncbi:MAG: DNA gyrase subunit A, partial [Lachnospiraceae bacterium]|nr:DNA gyrase subunit A [Lachnospiraceae bacterium]
LENLEKGLVEFTPNFDDTETEPTVLPAQLPNLLINGTTGIAVGMATNIPPHNLRETIDAVVRIIDDKIAGDETTIEDIMTIIKGPDFPTGAQILGTRGIEEAYRTGRGKIRVRAISTIEPMDNGKHRIIVTELPYLVNKARLIEKIAELHKDKKIDGITDLRDESDQKGMRVVIELKKEANPTVVLNHLYKHTQMQDSFGVIMLALVNNEPKVLNLLQMLNYYLLHQEEVVTRRTKYDLNKAEEREHIMEALLKALDFIDEVIAIIRSSKTTQEAKQRLMDRFEFDDVQAQAIVDMRLRQLTGLERSKLEEEFAALEARIAEYRKILSDEKELLSVIKTEITIIRDKYGDDRRTIIGYDEFDFDAEDLIPDDAVIIAMSRKGYIKRMSPEAFRTQNRGGKGIKGMQTIEEDFIERLLMTTNHHNLLFFTNLGRVYRLKAYEIPEASRTARGTAVINLIQLQPGETVTAMIPVRDMGEDGYLFMATKRGIIKKTKLAAFANIRKLGIIAISLRDDDQLIDVKVTNDETELMLITKQGAAVRFSESDVRATGRNGMGVYGMRLSEDDAIVSMVDTSEAEHVLFISENGYGKRTAPEEFALHHRGGKGMRCYNVIDKTGPLVGARMVDDTDEVIMITNEGILIRIPVEDISILGRSTSGVKCMNIDAESDIRVANFAKVCETEAYVIPGSEDDLAGDAAADGEDDAEDAGAESDGDI